MVPRKTTFNIAFPSSTSPLTEKIFFNPELRIYSQPATITSEAHIKTSFLEDKFIVMSNIPGEDYYNIRFQIKPFMIWIWLSILLISLGGFLSISLKKN